MKSTAKYMFDEDFATGAKPTITVVEAERRREQRAQELFPWVDEKMALVAPDRWLGEHAEFTMGQVRFEIHHLGPAHSPEDVIIVLPGEGVVFSGDILFAGRGRHLRRGQAQARGNRRRTRFPGPAGDDVGFRHGARRLPHRMVRRRRQPRPGRNFIDN